MEKEKKPTTLLIIEEHDVLREGLESILKNHDDIDIVGSTANADEAVMHITNLSPQIVVLGLRSSGEHDVCAEISKNGDSKILLLAPPGSEHNVAAAFKNGASGCLLTDVMAEDLIETIHLVAKGKMVLPQDMARETLVERRKRSRSQPEVSARELEVLQLMANGLSNKEIAEELHLSEVTVKTHVSRILRKLGKKNRISAILYAHRKGWVNLP
jgi:DNA-binding NarL/FixJ family response regulator